MMTEDDIINIMQKRDFSLVFKSSGATKELAFSYNNSHGDTLLGHLIPNIAAKVRLNDGNFKFSYPVPHSINVLGCDWCSPVDDTNQFARIWSPFALQATLLDKYNNI